MDIFAVEAYTASWIEIDMCSADFPALLSKPIRLRGLKLFFALIIYTAKSSKPIRLRGLKLFYNDMDLTLLRRSLYGFVD